MGTESGDAHLSCPWTLPCASSSCPTETRTWTRTAHHHVAAGGEQQGEGSGTGDAHHSASASWGEGGCGNVSCYVSDALRGSGTSCEAVYGNVDG